MVKTRPVAIVLSGATTSYVEAQLTIEGEALLREGMLVTVDSPEGLILARVDSIIVYSGFYEAGDVWSLARREGYTPPTEGYSIARLRLLGVMENGLRDVRKPPTPGARVYMLKHGSETLRALYGVEPGDPGIVWYGSLLGYEDLPVAFNVEALTMHLGVFGETGSGKSYGFGYLIELLSQIPIGGGEYSALPAIVFDANGDYLDYWDYFSRGRGLGAYSQVVRFVVPSSPARRLPYTRQLTISLTEFTLREVAETIILYKTGGFELNEMQVNALEKALRQLAEEGYNPYTAVVEEPELVINTLDELSKLKLAHHQTARAAAAAVEKFHTELVKTHRLVSLKPTVSQGLIDETTMRPSLVIVDFSSEGSPGIPLPVKQLIVGYVARLLYTVFTGYKLRGEERYLLLAVEEAQNYAPNARLYPVHWSLARDILSLIATQGRKFGICLAVISQRPSFVDPIVISMLNTIIVHRLSPDDIAYISRALGGLPKTVEAKLTTLPRGYALIAGQANMLGEPVIVKVGKRVVPHRMGTTNVIEYLKRAAAKKP